MNVISAIRYGTRFRRKNYDGWFVVRPNEVYRLTKADLLARDWEVEKPEIEITRDKLYEAYEIAAGEARDHGSDIVSVLAEELGL